MRRQVAKLVAEIFAEMTFIFGDVHCDPHQVGSAQRAACVISDLTMTLNATMVPNPASCPYC